MRAKTLDKETSKELQRAIEANAPERLKGLLETGISLNQRITDDDVWEPMTLLEFAVDRNAIEIMKFLIEAGAKLEAGVYKPLIHAALVNQLEAARLLLEAGADPNVTRVERDEEDVRGVTALMNAVERPEQIEMVKLLLKHNADPHLANTRGHTALHEAVDRENFEAVRVLLKAGCKPSGPILHRPAFLGTRKGFEMVKLLIAAGADLNAIGNREAAFQHRTAVQGVRDLLKDKNYMIRLLERREREDWDEETLQRWKSEAELYEEMIQALSGAKGASSESPSS